MLQTQTFLCSYLVDIPKCSMWLLWVMVDSFPIDMHLIQDEREMSPA